MCQVHEHESRVVRTSSGVASIGGDEKKQIQVKKEVGCNFQIPMPQFTLFKNVTTASPLIYVVTYIS